MNHGYVDPSCARAATAPPRSDVAPPPPPPELDDAPLEFDPFDDFPHARRKADYDDHPAKRGELAGGLFAPPASDPTAVAGGRDLVGHHIERRGGDLVPAAGVPNYPHNPSGPQAYEPTRPVDHPSPRSRALEDPPGPERDPASASAWSTSAHAQMRGEPGAPARRRGGKRAPPPVGAHLGASSASLGFRAGGHAYGRSTPGFGPKPAPLEQRPDVLHRNVDVRGGCGTETLPFVPGYGGHVPETRANFADAAARGLRRRMPKELLVENFNPRMAGCTKANAPRGVTPGRR